jgi:hypothetical protein
MLPSGIELEAVESNWKEVMDNFLGFMEALERFQSAAPDCPIDLLGPELQLVYQASLQRKKPVWVIEFLEMTFTQKGSISHLIPRQPEPIEPVESTEQPDKEEEQPSEEAPLEPEGGKKKGDASASPKKESKAKGQDN